jgi:fatty acid desaturase
MTPAKIFLRIKKDPSYLLRMYVRDTFIFSFLCLFFFRLGHSHISYGTLVAFFPLAVVLGAMIGSFIHNSSHSNVGNKILNRVVGEFCGTWTLYGFSNFVMIHMLHHQYTDEKHDPVNPKGMNFFIFLSAPMRYMVRVTKGWLNEVHGEKEGYQDTMKAQTILFHLNLVLRLTFWYFVFGPELFVCFYLPSLAANYGVHAHINYVCHRDMEDGSVEIVNLNHNIYYKFANLITFGGYFHKSHHLKLNVFNPASLGNQTIIPKKSRKASSLKEFFDLDGVWGEKQKPIYLTSQKKPHQMAMFKSSAVLASMNTTPRMRRVP